LGQRVRHNIPHRIDPERFHLEKSEIEKRLGMLAKKLEAGGSAKAALRARRVVVTTEIIGGRRITVQKARMPFAVFVGGPQ
jgi:predicted deacylase